MSDPLAEALPWLDLARKLFPVGRYLAARHRALQRIKGREHAESMRRARIRLEQACMLHGLPDDADGSPGDGPLWCGCWWHRDVIYTRSGARQRVIRVSRRAGDAGTWRVVSFADTGDYPDGEVLDQVREALGLPGGGILGG